MKIKKSLILVLILALMIFVFSGCQSKNTEDMDKLAANEQSVKYELEPDYGGKVVLPLTNFASLNPLVVENSYYYQFSKLIFEPLFEFDSNLSPEAKLVESYNVSPDGLIVEIKLKDNILWHDNEKLSTKDVGFTIDTIKSLGLEGTYGKSFNESLGVLGGINLNQLINYKIVDDLNMQIVFDKSYGNRLEVLTFPIIPSHIFEGNINLAKIKENYIPIGTGPYKYESYENYKILKLKSNENYWKGKPYIDEVVGKVLDDENLVQIGFETGQITMSPAVGVDWHKYKEKDSIRVVEYISSEYEFLGFNFDREKYHSENGKNLRKAINYGIDRQAIIEKVYLGHGVQVDVPTHPNSYLMSENATNYGYNKDRSIEILSEMGYKDFNDANFLVNENNETINITILTNRSNVLRERTAEMIVENLIGIGINATVEELPEFEGQTDIEKSNNEWEYINQRVAEGSYDVLLSGWNFSQIQEFLPIYHSSHIANRQNFIKFSSEGLDKILEDNFSAVSRDVKINENKKLEDYLIENLPYVSLIYRNNGLLLDNSIKGNLEPKYSYLYSGLEEAYINTKEK